jgi:hypothetical protein
MPMRSFLLLPVMLALTAGCGLAICAALGKNPHTTEMSLAAAALVVASAFGALPVFVARRATQIGVSQAALVGTMSHLFVAVGFAAVVILGHFNLHASFLYWLMAFYWMTLIALVAAFVRAIKLAAPATQASTSNGVSSQNA